jgi:hypothetical protein
MLGFLASMLWAFAGWAFFRNLQFDAPNIANTTGQVDSLRHFVGRRSESYNVYFHYVVGNIMVVTSENVQAITWNSLHSGDSIPILYRTQVPTDCRVNLPAENVHWIEVPRVMGALAILFTVPSLVFAWLYYHERQKGSESHLKSHEPRLVRAIKAGWRGIRREEIDGDATG